MKIMIHVGPQKQQSHLRNLTENLTGNLLDIKTIQLLQNA